MPSRRQGPSKRRGTSTQDLRDLRVGLYCRVSRRGDDDDAADKAVQEKSTRDQEREGRHWIAQHQCKLAGVYVDDGISASWYAEGKKRQEFERLQTDIGAGKLDVVWFWEQSRSTRRLGVYADLRDLCRKHGVLWVIRDRVYDPGNASDMLSPAIQAIIAEDESEKLSDRVYRGKESGAAAGRPAGRPPYGYRRVYEERRSVRDVPDEWNDVGRPIEDTPAYIVREIFDRLASGATVLSIWRDLNARGIPTQGGKRWYHSTVRWIAMNPAYIGKRIRHGKIMDGVAGFGEPLVDEETFWAVQRILTDESRSTWRARSNDTIPALLSSLARCAECGAKLIRAKGQSTGRSKERPPFYHCAELDCVTITTPRLDDYVEEVIVRWLADPAVAAVLTAGDDSATAKMARADANRARIELEEWRQLAERGEVTPVSFARAEKALLDRIQAADDIAQAATMPTVLRGKLGKQARTGWDDLDRDGKRQLIRTVADIRVRRSEPWQRGPRALPVHERVEWRWLLGPTAQSPEGVERTTT
jgi:site-specific DNA recombinase